MWILFKDSKNDLKFCIIDFFHNHQFWSYLALNFLAFLISIYKLFKITAITTIIIENFYVFIYMFMFSCLLKEQTRQTSQICRSAKEKGDTFTEKVWLAGQECCHRSEKSKHGMLWIFITSFLGLFIQYFMHTIEQRFSTFFCLWASKHFWVEVQTPLIASVGIHIVMIDRSHFLQTP